MTLQAFAAAAAAVPDARLRMIGDGPLLEACRESVRRLGRERSIDFLGAQPASVVREEMMNARAFVQHSIEAPSGDCEGMPVSILEASVSGLPILSTRHAGIPEAVIENETGVLVDERDVDGMAEAMTMLLRDPQMAARMGRQARDHVRRNFDMDVSIRRLSDILRGCAQACVPSDAASLAVSLEGA